MSHIKNNYLSVEYKIVSYIHIYIIYSFFVVVAVAVVVDLFSYSFHSSLS